MRVITNEHRDKLIKALLEDQGLNLDGFLETYHADDVVPAICTECEGVSDNMEPDQREGYCEHCGKSKVISGLVLMGVI